MTITDNLRDAAYIAIGMGVIGVQRAQVRREEIRKQFTEQRTSFEGRVNDARQTFETRGAEAVKLVGDLVKQADAAVEPVIKAVEERIDGVVELLPEQAKPAVKQARQAQKDARQTVRARVAAV